MSEDKKNGEKYTYATGRRKAAVAKVRIYDGTAEGKAITINNKDCKDYFTSNNILIEKVYSPLKLLNLKNKLEISVKVNGGGLNGQAEAARLGIARALLSLNKDYKKELKAYGYLTRNSRRVERKKPGLKKARRAPQWQKR